MGTLLGVLTRRSWRRGLRGEPLWLAVAAAGWLVRRARRRDGEVLWSGPVAEGQHLVVTTRPPRRRRGGEAS
jgi:hypothetical protein